MNCRQKYAEKRRVDKSAGGIQAGSSLASLGKQVFKSAPLKELENILIVAISRIIPHPLVMCFLGRFWPFFLSEFGIVEEEKMLSKELLFLRCKFWPWQKIYAKKDTKWSENERVVTIFFRSFYLFLWIKMWQSFKKRKLSWVSHNNTDPKYWKFYLF